MLPLPYHRGQKKPWTSIPRINWDHPLARGLISYGYDVGIGPIDLVTGGERTVLASANPPYGGPKSSKFGSGLNSVTDTAHTTTVALYTLPGNTDMDNFNVAAPYSFACGFMFTATPGSTVANRLFSLDQAASGVQLIRIGIAGSGTTDIDFGFADGASQNTAAGALKINTFQTALGVAVTGSAATCYVDGALNLSPAVTTTHAVAAASIPTFFGFRSNAVQNFPSGFIYYAALWKNRALTAPEARLLHDDPYCFLIYPEDEMLSLGGSSIILVLGDYSLDAGLTALNTLCDKVFVCASAPISYADATSGANSLGSKNWGAGNAFGSPAARSGGGRQITSSAVVDGIISTAGTVAFWAAVDSANSRLLAYGALTGGAAVTVGQVFTLSAMTFGIPNT